MLFVFYDRQQRKDKEAERYDGGALPPDRSAQGEAGLVKKIL